MVKNVDLEVKKVMEATYMTEGDREVTKISDTRMQTRNNEMYELETVFNSKSENYKLNTIIISFIICYFFDWNEDMNVSLAF